MGVFPTTRTWRAGAGQVHAQLCSKLTCSHAGQLWSSIFIEALVDEGGVQLGCCAMMKHSGHFGTNLLFSWFPA